MCNTHVKFPVINTKSFWLIFPKSSCLGKPGINVWYFVASLLFCSITPDWGAVEPGNHMLHLQLHSSHRVRETSEINPLYILSAGSSCLLSSGVTKAETLMRMRRMWQDLSICSYRSILGTIWEYWGLQGLQTSVGLPVLLKLSSRKIGANC